MSGLDSAERVDHAVMRKGAIKTFGNGGLFSFSGRFHNKALGHFRAFITDWNRLVLLRIGRRKILLSPDDPEAFVWAVRKERRLS